LGPARGIHAPLDIATKALAGGANALLVTPGFTKKITPVLGPAVGIVLRVSILPGLAPGATQEVPIASVETALRLDADAVAVSIFFGRGDEGQTLRFLGELTEAANRYDLPVVAEMMPPAEKSFDPEAIGHAARIGFELGADLIKTNYCGNIAAFRDVVASSPVPIIVAGGPSNGGGDLSVLQTLRDVLEAGAAGVAFGRRVWQAADPEGLVRQMAGVMFAAGKA
jgi:fructose-bisphosphate aldolase/2-amino-3,7-dideoxy-D-threo-hept-6-ulosonate synthase